MKKAYIFSVSLADRENISTCLDKILNFYNGGAFVEEPDAVSIKLAYYYDTTYSFMQALNVIIRKAELVETVGLRKF